MLALVGEGVARPTAEQVAARAGVGLRSVFRHFRDMESLYVALDARVRAEVAPLVAGAAESGAAALRARALVHRRAQLFERIAPYKRAANLARQRSPHLDAAHRALVRELRGQLARWLPELAEAPRAVRSAIEQATSFEAWDRLRGDQALSAASAEAAVEATVVALLGLR
jgi:AcrR family transcriptional regulator